MKDSISDKAETVVGGIIVGLLALALALVTGAGYLVWEGVKWIFSL